MINPEEIKKRKLQELLARQSMQGQQEMFEMQQQTQQLEEIKLQLKAVMSQIMSKEAMQRLQILRGTRTDYALQVELMFLELYRQGKLKVPVSEKEFRDILTQVAQKKETKIKRR